MSNSRRRSEPEPLPQGESEQAPFSESPESQPPPPPDPYEPLRVQAGQLEAALKKLEQVEADIIKVRGELSATKAKRIELMSQQDMNVLSDLGSRVNACQDVLEHLAGRLLEVQRDVQSRLMELGGRANSLYRQTRGELINRTIDEILALLHPDVREMQRQLVFHNLAQFGTAVIDAQQHLAIEPHPLASNPLEDTSFKAWSQEREATMRMVRQEAKIVLERLPKLLETTVGLETAAPLQASQQQEAA